ncbi:helix-turn-helix transcriptional regulator [Luteimicrobium xylanilyticum]|uniref:HTH cro/C1-type domain-containing protein n=1 Tax=Luteimicrobium xylanilyticum TaxID=1133546 RepID=A0A5P9QFL1_9MICO|nr:helix-turn-helix domain-containing protein [Luteimicrobium xylanilyticum]QFU99235.1 hypothetical protein KDY119_02762 [Luteimicrobium xylanilyticum]
MSGLVGTYLRDRRQLLRPADVNLRLYPGRRRVAGLRREEVAELAGISPEYYVRLEQGRGHQPSAQVLGALGRALQLGPDARAYLRRLARLDAGETPADQPPTCARDRSLTALVDVLTFLPAVVVDRNQDVVAANGMAARICDPALAVGANAAVEAFSRRDDARWERGAAAALAALRFHADPRGRRFAEVVDELSDVGGARFAELWARHEARRLTPGPVVLGTGQERWELRLQPLDVPACPGATLLLLSAPPGTREAHELGRMAAAERRADLTADTDLATDPARLPVGT